MTFRDSSRPHSPGRRQRVGTPDGIAPPLLRWYDAHKRDLPWRRREHDAYAQLVAEMMLQQTQVSTVVPFYERFLGRFPTVESLAAAGIDDVTALWAGLGYYRRARHLHAAAREIVREHRGNVPATVEGLMALPGIGRYTAGAIASIAFGARAPVLDGNVTRVLMRLTGLEADPKSPGTRERLWSLAETALPRRRCGDFNQAIMELGATLCSPLTPECPQCPLRSGCRAHLNGSTDRIPPPARRARVQSGCLAVAAIRQGSELMFVQRPSVGLWAGLWELPSEPAEEGETIETTRRRLLKKLPAGTRLASQPAGTVVRQLTHREFTFHVFEGTMPASAALGNGRWATPRAAAELGISRACQAILRLLDDPVRSGRYNPRPSSSARQGRPATDRHS